MLKKDFINHVLAKNGDKAQAVKCIEELCELAHCMARFANGEHGEALHAQIVEELSDVVLMLEQMKTVFQIDDIEVETAIHKKIERYIAGERNDAAR